MTVKELIDMLKTFPLDMEVKAVSGAGEVEEITDVTRDYESNRIQVESDIND